MSQIQKPLTMDGYTQTIINAGPEVYDAVASSGENPRSVLMRFYEDPSVKAGETFKSWAEDHYAIPRLSPSWLQNEVDLIFLESPWVRVNLPIDTEVVPVQEEDFSIAA